MVFEFLNNHQSKLLMESYFVAPRFRFDCLPCRLQLFPSFITKCYGCFQYIYKYNKAVYMHSINLKLQV